MPEIIVGSKVYFNRETKHVPYICAGVVERFEHYGGRVVATVHVTGMRLKHSAREEFDLTADYRTERFVRWLRLRP